MAACGLQAAAATSPGYGVMVGATGGYFPSESAYTPHYGPISYGYAAKPIVGVNNKSDRREHAPNERRHTLKRRRSSDDDDEGDDERDASANKRRRK